ncbi:MAG: hypothetical protein H6677_07675 [Candidatus Obscuribacterales bacterium]|nr:hypothetical protein [Candidatus Obscuribacterales bacterium]
MKTLSKFANFSIFAGVLTIALIMLFKHLQLIDLPLFSLGTMSDLYLVASCTLVISLVKCTWKEPLRAWLEKHERNNLIGHMRVEDKALNRFVKASHDASFLVLCAGTALILINLINYALLFSSFVIGLSGNIQLGERVYESVTKYSNHSSLVTCLTGDSIKTDPSKLRKVMGIPERSKAKEPEENNLEFKGIFSDQNYLREWLANENQLTELVKDIYGDRSTALGARHEQMGKAFLFQIRDSDMARDSFANAFDCNYSNAATERAVENLSWIIALDFEKGDLKAVGRNSALAIEIIDTRYKTRELNASLNVIADFASAAGYPATATRIKTEASSFNAPSIHSMEALSPRDDPTLFPWLMGALVSVFTLGIAGRFFADRRIEALAESWTEGYLQARHEGERMAYLDKLTTLELCRDDLERAEAYSALMLDANKREKDPMLLHRILRSSKGTY